MAPPSNERKHPEIFCLTSSILKSCSAWLLVKDTCTSYTKAKTLPILCNNLLKRLQPFWLAFSLEDCSLVKAIQIITQGCRGVEKLKLKDCKKISDSILVSISQNTHQLMKLNLSDCSHITGGRARV